MFPIHGTSALEIPYLFLPPSNLNPNPNPRNEDELLYLHLLDASRTIPPIPGPPPLHPPLPSALIPRSLLAANDWLLDEYVCTCDYAEDGCQAEENDDAEMWGGCGEGVVLKMERQGWFEGQCMAGDGRKGGVWEGLEASEGGKEERFVEEEEEEEEGEVREVREVPVIRVEMVEEEAPLTGLRKPPTRKRKRTIPVEETPVKRGGRAAV